MLTSSLKMSRDGDKDGDGDGDEDVRETAAGNKKRTAARETQRGKEKRNTPYPTRTSAIQSN